MIPWFKYFFYHSNLQKSEWPLITFDPFSALNPRILHTCIYIVMCLNANRYSVFRVRKEDVQFALEASQVLSALYVLCIVERKKNLFAFSLSYINAQETRQFVTHFFSFRVSYFFERPLRYYSRSVLLHFILFYINGGGFSLHNQNVWIFVNKINSLE